MSSLSVMGVKSVSLTAFQHYFVSLEENTVFHASASPNLTRKYLELSNNLSINLYNLENFHDRKYILGIFGWTKNLMIDPADKISPETDHKNLKIVFLTFLQ